ncbi:EamA family transporter [Paenibacillus tyrfis]|uniref:EamA family transporter n=1 Tax=Paenibacillus tyrfis TaxID=1501230 RepID=UPI0006921787|nr:EamA family transporter [Paenibacillus tyrfis]
MWVIYASCAALFAGITSILAKIGIQKIDSNLATALRTGIVVIFAWIIVFAGNIQYNLLDISLKSLLFLILSGVTTGASWIFYFRALQLGNVNVVSGSPVNNRKSLDCLKVIGRLALLLEKPFYKVSSPRFPCGSSAVFKKIRI